MPIYHRGDPMQPGEFPAILVIGDSWFWYPKNNLLNALARHPKLKDPYKNMLLLGYNGAKLSEYIFGKFAKDFYQELEPVNLKYYSAILISGAGNDAVDYKLGLFQDCSSFSTAEQCVNSPAMTEFLGDLGLAIGAMLQQIRKAWSQAKRPQPDIFLHTYDYPIPDGRGFDLLGYSVTGPWLKSAMDACSVPDNMALRRNICEILVQRLSEEFGRYADPRQGVYLVRSHDCLHSASYQNDWDNELHPTSRGFEKIADERWIPVLAQLGYAK